MKPLIARIALCTAAFALPVQAKVYDPSRIAVGLTIDAAGGDDRDLFAFGNPGGPRAVSVSVSASQPQPLTIIVYDARLREVARGNAPSGNPSVSFEQAGSGAYLRVVPSGGRYDTPPGTAFQRVVTSKTGNADQLSPYRIAFALAAPDTGTTVVTAESRPGATAKDATSRLVNISVPPAGRVASAPARVPGPDLFGEVSPEILRQWGVLALAAGREFALEWRQYGHSKVDGTGSARFEWAPDQVGRKLLEHKIVHYRGYVNKWREEYEFVPTAAGIRRYAPVDPQNTNVSYVVADDGSLAGRLDRKPKETEGYGAAGPALLNPDRNGEGRFTPAPGAYEQESASFDDDNARLTAEEHRKNSEPGFGGALFGAMVGGWASGGSVDGMVAGARAFSQGGATGLYNALDARQVAAHQEAERSNASFLASMDAIRARATSAAAAQQQPIGASTGISRPVTRLNPGVDPSAGQSKPVAHAPLPIDLPVPSPAPKMCMIPATSGTQGYSTYWSEAEARAQATKEMATFCGGGPAGIDSFTCKPQWKGGPPACTVAYTCSAFEAKCPAAASAR